MSDREPIIQAADGEVKPDPPIEIYRSELHHYNDSGRHAREALAKGK